MIKKICIFIMPLMCLICLSSCSVLKEKKEELDETKFIFDNKLRVIYTFGNTDPASFIMFVNEVK